MTTMLQKTFASAALAATMLVGSTMIAPAEASHSNSSSQAGQARVSADLNLRYGPSRDYYVIQVIPYGRNVDIIRCLPQRDWCEVRYYGDTGWVSSNYLYNPQYDRSYSNWNRSDWVVAFDFFAHITDYARDRRHRYDRHRHNNDYYNHVRRHGRSGHDSWGNRHHGNNHGNRHGSSRGRGHNSGHNSSNNSGHNSSNNSSNNSGHGSGHNSSNNSGHGSQASYDRGDNHDRGNRRGGRSDRHDRNDRSDRSDRSDRHDRNGHDGGRRGGRH